LEAAEAAIKSPLLDNVDLKGASGILVNVTGGVDLSLGEFTEVGDLVGEYADENATIVVGTVIDPELTDELKVTVVATGLDKPKEKAPEVKKGPKKADGSLDLDEIDLPTVLRRQRQEALNGGTAKQAAAPKEEESKQRGQRADSYLDIPTFLRKQND